MKLQDKKGFICDMDGVIYHGNQLLPGVKEFINWVKDTEKKFLFLTNSSRCSPKELAQKLSRMGLDIDESHFYTSALSTAAYLAKQKPGCTAYVIGEAGLINALYDVGITMNDVNPDYVVIGETANYNFANIAKAVKLVENGAKLIGTNPDITGQTDGGVIEPACKALVSPVEIATGKCAYFLGKPNPLMMRCGLNILGCNESDVAIIGDRMDTDIIAGIESEIDTVLVLTGVTSKATLETFPYRPKFVLDGIGDVMNN